MSKGRRLVRALHRRELCLMYRAGLLITPAGSLAVDRAKAGDDNVYGYLGVFGLRSSAAARSRDSTARTGLARPVHDAHDFGVAHLEVAGPVSSRLGPDLGVNAPQLVPPPAVNAEQPEAVC